MEDQGRVNKEGPGLTLLDLSLPPFPPCPSTGKPGSRAVQLETHVSHLQTTTTLSPEGGQSFNANTAALEAARLTAEKQRRKQQKLQEFRRKTAERSAKAATSEQVADIKVHCVRHATTPLPRSSVLPRAAPASASGKPAQSVAQRGDRVQGQGSRITSSAEFDVPKAAVRNVPAALPSSDLQQAGADEEIDSESSPSTTGIAIPEDCELARRITASLEHYRAAWGAMQTHIEAGSVRAQTFEEEEEAAGFAGVEY